MINNERYHRQILLSEIGEEGQQRLKSARILLIGVGGLGTPIATYLTAAGIGTLGLADDDVVTLTNLHRQVLYTETEVGYPKAECAARRLRHLNGEVTIETYPFRLTPTNARKLIRRYDIVMDGCDNFATRFLLSDTCSDLGIPYIYGAICGWEGQVSILCHPCGKTTYRTLFPDEQATLRLPHPGRQVIGITPAVVGSIQAGEALKLICGYETPLIDQMWTIDLRTLQTHLIQL